MKNFSLQSHFGDESRTRMYTTDNGRVVPIFVSDLSDEDILRVHCRLHVLSEKFKEEFERRQLKRVVNSHPDDLPF